MLLLNPFFNFVLLLVKALWDKTLEFRFLLQKAFSSSNRLPQVHYEALVILLWLYIIFATLSLTLEIHLQEPVRSSFCASDEGVSAAYADLITSSNKTLDSLLELQEVCLLKNQLPASFSLMCT